MPTTIWKDDLESGVTIPTEQDFLKLQERVDKLEQQVKDILQVKVLVKS